MWANSQAADTAGDLTIVKHTDRAASSFTPILGENGLLIRLNGGAQFREGFFSAEDFIFTENAANIALIKSGVYTRVNDSQVMITGLNLTANAVTVSVRAEGLVGMVSEVNTTVLGLQSNQPALPVSAVFSAAPANGTTLIITFDRDTGSPAITYATFATFFEFRATVDAAAARAIGTGGTWAFVYNSAGTELTITFTTLGSTPAFEAGDIVVIKPSTALNPSTTILRAISPAIE